MKWNYRVLAHKQFDEVYFYIHEVYYDEEGNPNGYIERIDVINAGKGYLVDPVVTIVPSLSGRVNVLAVFVAGAAIVNAPVPLAFERIFILNESLVLLK